MIIKLKYLAALVVMSFMTFNVSLVDASARMDNPEVVNQTQITIRMNTGRVLRVNVKSDGNVNDVKQAIFAKEGIPIDEQVLIAGGKAVNNEDNLRSMNLSNRGVGFILAIRKSTAEKE